MGSAHLFCELFCFFPFQLFQFLEHLEHFCAWVFAFCLWVIAFCSWVIFCYSPSFELSVAIQQSTWSCLLEGPTTHYPSGSSRLMHFYQVSIENSSTITPSKIFYHLGFLSLILHLKRVHLSFRQCCQ